MKKTILISIIASSVLFADALTDMAKNAAVSSMKTEAKTMAMEQVASATGVSADVVKQVADKVVPEASPTDTLKNAAVSKVMGATGTSATDVVSSAVSGGGSMTDKAVDMAVEKTIGDNAMAKNVAKKAVNAVMK